MDNNELLMIVLAFFVGYMCSGMIRQMCGGRLVEGKSIFDDIIDDVGEGIESAADDVGEGIESAVDGIESIPKAIADAADRKEQEVKEMANMKRAYQNKNITGMGQKLPVVPKKFMNTSTLPTIPDGGNNSLMCKDYSFLNDRFANTEISQCHDPDNIESYLNDVVGLKNSPKYERCCNINNQSGRCVYSFYGEKDDMQYQDFFGCIKVPATTPLPV